jgi:hypothetical protein
MPCDLDQFCVQFSHVGDVSRNGCGGASLQSCYDGEIPRRSVVVGHTWALSPKIVNDVRLHYAYSAYLLGPAEVPVWTDIGNYTGQRLAQLQIGLSFPSFSYGYTYGADGIEKRYQVKDDLTILKGTHAVKFGFDYSHVPFADDSGVRVAERADVAAAIGFQPVTDVLAHIARSASSTRTA